MWCYAPIENNGANFVYERYMLPALELVRDHSLDTIGTKAIDQLEKTLSKCGFGCAHSNHSKVTPFCCNQKSR